MRIEDTDFIIGKNRKPNEAEKEEFGNLVFKDLGLCGCGDPDAVLDMLEYFLSRHYLSGHEDNYIFTWEEKEIFAKEHSTELLLFLLYILNDKGFLDHGSSVMGSWITEKGERFLELLQKDVEEDQ